MKTLIIISLWISFNSLASTMPHSRVLMMVPDDFMWPEYAEPRRLYNSAKFDVKIAGKSKSPRKPDSRMMKAYPDSKDLHVDLTFDEVKVEDYDAITFVAGHGAWSDFFPNPKVHEIVSQAFNQQKILGLLCGSTGLLAMTNNWDGNHPIAPGRKAVAYFRVEGMVQKLGKITLIPGGRTQVGVVRDGHLITGRNPESSKLFGEKIVEALKHK